MLEEMLEETFEGLEEDDVEELADQEVEKVLWEVTSGQLGELSGVSTSVPEEEGVRASLFITLSFLSVSTMYCLSPTENLSPQAVGPEPEAQESDEEEEMTARLQALRS